MIYEPLSPREPSVGESATPSRERYYQTADEVRLLRARIRDCPRETFSENHRIWESLREVVDERLRNAAEAERVAAQMFSDPALLAEIDQARADIAAGKGVLWSELKREERITDDLLSRLDEFAAIESDWDSYGADPISPAAVTLARAFLVALGARFAPDNVAPIADGGIQMEWRGAGRNMQIEITATGEMTTK